MSLSLSLTTRLEYQHNSIGDLIEGLSDEQIRRQVIPGKWSIFENIAHLATYQHAFLDRLHKILSQENPEFGRYNAESDPLFYDNCLRPTREIMQDLTTTRRKLIDEILSIEPGKFHRAGGHPVFGKLNITQWLHFFLLHEAHHLFTVFKLIPELKKEARRPA
jgi:uncharacterized damage-inducible protein DinB